MSDEEEKIVNGNWAMKIVESLVYAETGERMFDEVRG
jgi:hypothetical protein